MTTRAQRRIAARRRDRPPWLAAAVTTGLIAGAVATIALAPSPPIKTAPVRVPVVAPLAPVTPAPAVTIIVGKLARPGSDCADEDMPGVDDNGTPTVCQPTADGLRWTRR
jgi:hypothetical protein